VRACRALFKVNRVGAVEIGIARNTCKCFISEKSEKQVLENLSEMKKEEADERR
jgi:hypothetical protein